MPTRQRRSRWGLAVAAVLVVAACKDSTGPQAHLSDPAGLSSDVQSVAAVLQSPTFLSFSLLSDSTKGSPTAVPSRMGILLRAAPILPPSTPSSLGANAAARMQALRRRAATTFSGAISASVVPAPLLGTTWVWNTTTHAYEQDAAFTPAAPGDRVRIILYAVDPFTHDVVETPLTPTGFVDLVDESTTAPPVDKLHVIVSGGTPASPGTAYADYTVSGQVTGNPATAFTATAAGFVSDGTHTLTFSATFAATQLDTDNADLQIDIIWDLDNPAIHVELHETLTLPDASHLNLTLGGFSVTHGAETVSMHGTIAITQLTLISQTVTMNLTIDVNDVPWVRLRGTDDGITVRYANGSELSPADYQAFLDLSQLPGAIEFAILSLFGPCQSLMGA